MKLEAEDRLRAECAGKPAGIAVLVDAPELKQLLEERDGLRVVLSELFNHLMDECDITDSGGPNLAMRTVNNYGPRVVGVLHRCDE